MIVDSDAGVVELVERVAAGPTANWQALPAGTAVADLRICDGCRVTMSLALLVAGPARAVR